MCVECQGMAVMDWPGRVGCGKAVRVRQGLARSGQVGQGCQGETWQGRVG
jgi:hypothetical protein